jgi:hypothetical protein
VVADLERLQANRRRKAPPASSSGPTLVDGKGATMPEEAPALDFADVVSEDDSIEARPRSLLWLLAGVGLSVVLVAILGLLWLFLSQ